MSENLDLCPRELHIQGGAFAKGRHYIFFFTFKQFGEVATKGA